MVALEALLLESGTGQRQEGYGGWRLGSADMGAILVLPPDEVLVQIFADAAPSKELRFAMHRGEVLRSTNFVMILLPVGTKPAVRQRFLAAVAAHEATTVTRS